MKTVVQQWGTSLAVKIPKALAHPAKIKKGSHVRLAIENRRIVVKPLEKNKITLKSLIARITPENIHAETDWGKPRGREIQ